MKLCGNGKMEACKIFFKAITVYLLSAEFDSDVYFKKNMVACLLSLLIPVGKM